MVVAQLIIPLTKEAIYPALGIVVGPVVVLICGLFRKHLNKKPYLSSA
jgi:uncharacterized membrane protein YvlD (DUF360 family)